MILLIIFKQDASHFHFVFTCNSCSWSCKNACQLHPPGRSFQHLVSLGEILTESWSSENANPWASPPTTARPGTTTHLCLLLEFHIFSMTIELNISLTCIIMKLNMKSMVVHTGGSRDESEAVGGHCWWMSMERLRSAREAWKQSHVCPSLRHSGARPGAAGLSLSPCGAPPAPCPSLRRSSEVRHQSGISVYV